MARVSSDTSRLGEIISWGLANGYTFMPMDANSPMFHHSPAN